MNYRFWITKKPEFSMDMVGIEHVFCGGIYAKKTTIPSGVVLDQHKHNFDHLSILSKGRVKVTVDGVSKEAKAGDYLEIVAGKSHKVEAITDTVWFCIHATDCIDADEIDLTLIKEK
jgi:quercetin dioxygenase-like cupin family protein